MVSTPRNLAAASRCGNCRSPQVDFIFVYIISLLEIWVGVSYAGFWSDLGLGTRSDETLNLQELHKFVG